MTEQRPQRTLFCPLEIEARSLKKQGVSDPITISGPGAMAVEKAVRQAIKTPVQQHFILAGLAGGLDARILSGQAFWIDRILDAHGQVVGMDDSPKSVPSSIASIHMANKPIYSPAEKRLLHESSKADLVDMEALAFARACEASGVKWSIIRGVSDASDETLPPGSGSLIDQEGHSRPWRIAGYVLTSPWRIPALIRLSGRTSRALENVACELKKLD